MGTDIPYYISFRHNHAAYRQSPAAALRVNQVTSETIIMKMGKLFIVLVSLGLAGKQRVKAQTFTTLYNFSNNGNGMDPQAGLILSTNKLYGTTFAGGVNGYGSVFAINTNGNCLTNVYSFIAPNTTNSSGNNPISELVLCKSRLYGTAEFGGSYNAGTVFAVNIDGSDFTNFHSFSTISNHTNIDGAFPQAGLLLASNILYGTTYGGGTHGSGTIFSINTDGTDFTNLHNFISSSDGANPYAGLIICSNTLYGTAYDGVTNGQGTVFSMSTDGTNFTIIYTFTTPHYGINNDGANPYAGLTISGNTLYGTAWGGGNFGSGTVFAVNTDGTGFTNLHSFSAVSSAIYPGPNNSQNAYFNTDGLEPEGSLTLSGNTLYGTTFNGGSGGSGTVFSVKTNGMNFTNLYEFKATTNYTNNDGANPQSQLLFTDNTLYGTAFQGGGSGYGTIYSVSVQPAPLIVGINLSGAGLVINGANGRSGGTCYALMSTNLSLPFSQWISVATNTLNTSGSFTITVTNTVDATVPQRFYILQMQ
ncbi:MAG: choice-of-anchor tandem repeat GloVer-containing protein [Verrucomicrobiota bacterium]